MKIEISKPHYHPSKDSNYTKKRDLSVPPNWVANERIEKDGISYAIVMPVREEELFETRQPIHIHIPAYLEIEINGVGFRAKVKVSDYYFKPVIHVDEHDANLLGLKGNENVTI